MNTTLDLDVVEIIQKKSICVLLFLFILQNKGFLQSTIPPSNRLDYIVTQMSDYRILDSVSHRYAGLKKVNNSLTFME